MTGRDSRRSIERIKAFLRRHWRSFRAAPPGERFQRRYRRQAGRRGVLGKLLMVAAGFALAVAGLAMLVLPGPGLLAILLGALLVAGESLLAARLLDRVDLAVSRRVGRMRRVR